MRFPHLPYPQGSVYFVALLLKGPSLCGSISFIFSQCAHLQLVLEMLSWAGARLPEVLSQCPGLAGLE